MVIAMTAGAAWHATSSASALDPGNGVAGNSFNLPHTWGTGDPPTESDCGPFTSGYVWHIIATANADFTSLTAEFQTAGVVSATLGSPDNSHGWFSTPTMDTMIAIEGDTNPSGQTYQLSHFCDAGPGTGSITIVKDTVPDDDQNFTFRIHDSGVGSIDENFVLDDNGNDGDGTSSSKTYADLPAGVTYTLIENHSLEYTTTVVCDSDGDSSFGYFISPPTHVAFVDLAADDSVTCTYTNTYDPPLGDVVYSRRSSSAGPGATMTRSLGCWKG